MEVFKSFGIQPVLLLAQIVNFLIILALLRKFFYAPITKALEDRKKRIAESLQNADLIEEKLQKTNEDTAKILEEAQNNAQILITEAKNEAEKIAERATAEGRKIIEESMAEARSQIEAERQKMQKQLEQETLSLVIEVVKKVLGRNLKGKEKLDLTKNAVSEITKQIQ
jgi:F-type H+-transporting ATPase subunit b